MPANLTPQFIKARERSHKATTPEEKLAALEDMLATIPKHKGTTKMVGDIRKQIGKLRDVSLRAKKAEDPATTTLRRRARARPCSSARRTAASRASSRR
jgi:hypothetical protein